jgi:DNA damage-binding protein 1
LEAVLLSYIRICASKLLLFGVYHSLAIAKQSEFSIGTMGYIQNQKLRTIPLNEQPKRICHQEQSSTLAVCTSKYLDSGEQSEAHFIRLLDHQTFEFLFTHPLDQYECGCSMISCSFSDDNKFYYCVGTSYILPDEYEPAKVIM